MCTCQSGILIFLFTGKTPLCPLYRIETIKTIIRHLNDSLAFSLINEYRTFSYINREVSNPLHMYIQPYIMFYLPYICYSY